MKEININNNKQSISSVKIGEKVKIFDFVNLYGCSIGNNTKIGAFVEIQKDVEIGANCKISSHSFICEGVTIEDGVFVGHNTTFINDRYPKAVNEKQELKIEEDWILEKTTIKKGANIGSSCTIMCGVIIGENSFIGAGSVVLENVPPNCTVVGNPARIISK